MKTEGGKGVEVEESERLDIGEVNVEFKVECSGRIIRMVFGLKRAGFWGRENTG